VAIAVGVGSPIIGLYLSYWLDAAAGATIVLVETAVFLVALAVARVPRRVPDRAAPAA
jgi:manganese/iron transport system permease protein